MADRFQNNLFDSVKESLNKDFASNKNTENNNSKIFSKGNVNSQYSSKLRYDREYLLSKKTAKKLNTYLNFTPFATFNDVYKSSYEKIKNKDNKEEYVENGDTEIGTPGTRSLFNKSGAVIIGSSTGNPNIDISKGDANNTSEWRISNNVPLMDSPEARRRIRKNSGCSVKELVKASEDGLLGRETYDYSDFMYCKYLGRIPNNYLITLRRFPLPVDDYISSLGENSRKNKSITSQNVTSIGCLVTWLGTPGNDISNILSYSYKMPYKPQSAEWEDVQIDADSTSGKFNSFAAAFDPVYRKQYMDGMVGDAVNPIMEGFFAPMSKVGKFLSPGSHPYNSREFLNFRDRNKVYGPIDVIKETYMRSEDGLQFNQEITITFDYELRSYNGINTRQAMLDLISNILNVTYATGTFWGGGYRGGGAHQNNIFANMNIFKSHGSAVDFGIAFGKDLSGLWKSSPLGQKISANIDWKDPRTWGNALKQIGRSTLSALNQAGGMVIAGMLNKWGRPQRQMINSLLSPAPVGLWHLTIGNPNHPIMSMGNMILTDTKIEHYGPLGLDDFPTGLKVTCTLTRGKPRDIRDIEKLYMHGNDRIYSSMGPKIFDMYTHAKEYNKNKATDSVGDANTDMGTAYSNNNFIEELRKANLINTASNTKNSKIKETAEALPSNISKDQYDQFNSVLKKYFGHSDTYSIYVAAAEQEYGSDAKKPSKNQNGPVSGDSRSNTNKGGMTATSYYG